MAEATISSAIAITVIGILVILILLALAWSLYGFNNVASRDASISNNPFCVRSICTSDGSQNPAYTLNAEHDPERLAYERLNYCIVNGPPCALVEKVHNCNLSKDELITLGKWYHTSYHPVCKYEWNGNIEAGTSGNPGAGSDPNSVQLKNGPNDAFLISLYSCANKM